MLYIFELHFTIIICQNFYILLEPDNKIQHFLMLSKYTRDESKMISYKGRKMIKYI